MKPYRQWFVLPVVLLCVAIAEAAESTAPGAPALNPTGSDAYSLTIGLYRLASSVSMSLADLGYAADTYRAEAGKQMNALNAVIVAMKASDPLVPALSSHWPAIRQSARENENSGLLVDGYDSARFMAFVSEVQTLRKSLSEQHANPLPDRQIALLAVSSAVSNYLQVAADPMGSYNRSYNQDEEDIQANVAKADAAFERMAKAAGTQAAKDKLSDIRRSWNFVKVPLNTPNHSFTPWVVYHMGNRVMDALAE